jgi:hypothetical protein
VLPLNCAIHANFGELRKSEVQEISEDELLGPIFAELEPDARAYFTEELEDGVRVYYFDGYNATVEGASVARIDKG